jgi:hypothetical protein
MVTVLEEYITKEQNSVVLFFCGQKDSMQRTLIKKMFPVYSGKCLSRKAVHKWVKKLSQGRLEVADDARPGCIAEIAREETVQHV